MDSSDTGSTGIGRNDDDNRAGQIRIYNFQKDICILIFIAIWLLICFIFFDLLFI